MIHALRRTDPSIRKIIGIPSNALALCAVFALAACGVNPAPPDAYLYTLDQLVPYARAGNDPLSSEIISPAGTPIALLSPPYSLGPAVTQSASIDGINVEPAFSEGAVAAYGTTETWIDWPGPVWVQPLYFLVTGFDPNTGSVNFLDGHPIFGIGTDSRFYSSYWQIYYLQVPASTDPTQFHDVRAVLDSGYPLVMGALTFCAVTSENVNLAHPDGAATAVQPLTGDPIRLRAEGQGWVEGKSVTFIDFGRSRYLLEQSASDPSLVEADALFQFAIRDPATGAHVPLGVPRVGGTGPLYHHQTPALVQGRPQFGTLWHEYLVLLNPPAALINGQTAPAFFVPNDHPALRAQIIAEARNQSQWAPPPDSSLDSLPAAISAAYTLRLSANPSVCFQQANPDFPAGPCIWLDSQTAIENSFTAALIYDQEKLSSCPLLMFNGLEVAP